MHGELINKSGHNLHTLQEDNHKAAVALELMRRLEPFNPDPEHLDPHMEQLCRDTVLEDIIDLGQTG